MFIKVKRFLDLKSEDLFETVLNVETISSFNETKRGVMIYFKDCTYFEIKTSYNVLCEILTVKEV